MLASNQPYQKVDDGVGAGFIGGAVVGGAMAGGFHYGGVMASSAAVTGAEKLSGYARKGKDNVISLNNVKKSNKFTSGVDKASNFSDKMHSKAFGGGTKNKAIAYGGSVVAGSLLGMSADALNN